MKLKLDNLKYYLSQAKQHAELAKQVEVFPNLQINNIEKFLRRAEESISDLEQNFEESSINDHL